MHLLYCTDVSRHGTVLDALRLGYGGGVGCWTGLSLRVDRQTWALTESYTKALVEASVGQGGWTLPSILGKSEGVGHGVA